MVMNCEVKKALKCQAYEGGWLSYNQVLKLVCVKQCISGVTTKTSTTMSNNTDYVSAKIKT